MSKTLLIDLEFVNKHLDLQELFFLYAKLHLFNSFFIDKPLEKTTIFSYVYFFCFSFYVYE